MKHTNTTRKIHFSLLTLAGLLAFSNPANAQLAGTLDSTFGEFGNGVFLDDAFGNSEDEVIYEGAALPDGRSVYIGGGNQGGTPDVIVYRLTAGGVRDSSFANNGVSQLDFSIGGDDLGFSLDVQPDGKILIVGGTQGLNASDMFIHRLDTDGNLDTAFNSGMAVTIDLGNDDMAQKVRYHASGKIYVAGLTEVNNTDQVMVIRLNADGSFDMNFSGDGKQVVDPGMGSDFTLTGMEVDAAGNCYLSGYTSANDYSLVCKIDVNGNIDVTYGTLGYITYQYHVLPTYATDMTIDNNDNLWICGLHAGVQDSTFITKITPAATFDPAFSGDGFVSYYYNDNGTDIYFSAIAYTTEGILAGCGIQNLVHSVMYNADGSVKTAYGTNGISNVTTNASFASGLTDAFQLNNNSVSFAGYFQPSDLNTCITAVLIREPEYVGVINPVAVQTAVFPNPASTQFHIQTPENVTAERVELIDAQGKILAHYSGDLSLFPISQGLVTGIYFVRITTSAGVGLNKLYIAQ